MKTGKVPLRRFGIAAFATMCVTGFTPAFAWDGVNSGTIAGFDVTHGQNFGFRLYLNGVSTMCTGGQNWGYLNETDSNYKTYVGILMMAKAQGSSVTVFTNTVNGYCQIGYLVVR